MLLPAALFELISRLSNHTGQNKHTFQSRPFTFAWAALLSVLYQAIVVLEGRIRNRQETGLSQNSLWGSALSLVAGAGGTNSLALCAFCGVVLVCPVWPVARQVNDPAKNLILSTPLLPLLPVLARVQTNLQERKERELLFDSAVLHKLISWVISAHQSLIPDFWGWYQCLSKETDLSECNCIDKNKFKRIP